MKRLFWIYLVVLDTFRVAGNHPSQVYLHLAGHALQPNDVSARPVLFPKGAGFAEHRDPLKQASPGKEHEVEHALGNSENKKPSHRVVTEAEESAAKSIAALMLMFVISGTTILAMTQSRLPHVAAHTILVIEEVIAIFLAVLWFQGFDELMHEFLPDEDHWWASLVHMLVVMVGAFMLAFSLKHSLTALVIFCGCGSHYCAFTGRHAAIQLQETHFTVSPVICTLGLGVALLFIAIVVAALHAIKRAIGLNPGVESENEKVREFMERFDEVENDFAAMALASYWMLMVLFWIMQEYPEETEILPGSEPIHSLLQRNTMLFYSCMVLLTGCFAVGFVEKATGYEYFAKRLFNIFASFVCMSWVFSFLTWGQMNFYEYPILNMTPIFIRIVFAGACSVLAFTGIVALAISGRRGPAAVMLLRSLSLLVGISWEETFIEAVEVVVFGWKYQHLVKGLLAFGCFTLILPSYITYKPFALKAEKEEKDERTPPSTPGNR